MTHATSPASTSSGTAEGSLGTDGTTARRARAAALLVGAVLVAALVETGLVPFHWLPTLLGLTYLAAAAAGRSRGTLWAPGLVLTTAGVSAGLWLEDGRSADSFQFLALTVMALGLGGVLAALLGQVRGIAISPMSVATPVLLFGVFALLEQQTVPPFAGKAWVYAVLLALWALYELRPTTAR